MLSDQGWAQTQPQGAEEGMGLRKGDGDTSFTELCSKACRVMGRELERKVRYRCVSSQLAGKDGEMLNDHARDGTTEEAKSSH